MLTVASVIKPGTSLTCKIKSCIRVSLRKTIKKEKHPAIHSAQETLDKNICFRCFKVKGSPRQGCTQILLLNMNETLPGQAKTRMSPLK